MKTQIRIYLFSLAAWMMSCAFVLGAEEKALFANSEEAFASLVTLNLPLK